MIFTGYPLPEEFHPDSHIATCTGSKNCFACSSCRYCAYCNSGKGKCSICSSPSSLDKPKLNKLTSTNSASAQCKGITKKGSRCKRMVKGGEYCWQHT